MATAKVQVAIANDYLDRIDEVVRRCKQAGLKVEQQLEFIGVITGSIGVERLAALQKVEGVSSVEQTRAYDIPPPESDIQ